MKIIMYMNSQKSNYIKKCQKYAFIQLYSPRILLNSAVFVIQREIFFLKLCFVLTKTVVKSQALLWKSKSCFIVEKKQTFSSVIQQYLH